jgi:hypothetical protein
MNKISILLLNGTICIVPAYKSKKQIEEYFGIGIKR